MKRKNEKASRGNLVLFRVVCVVMALVLVISAIALSSHRPSSPSLISVLFAFVFVLLIFFQRNPGVGWWLALIALVLIWLILLAVLV